MRAVTAALGLTVMCLTAVAAAQSDRNSAAKCVLDGTSLVAFGAYDPMENSPLDVQGRVSYRCGTTIETMTSPGQRRPRSAAEAQGKLIVQISVSAGNSGTFRRSMRGGRDRLDYNLYLDPQRTIVWGDGTGGSQTYSAQARLDNQVLVVPVFGRVFPGQDVSADLYSDSLIVTLDF